MSMKNVEDVYPLSPMQEMMLLHAVSSRGRDTLLNQFCYDCSGTLDVDALRAAWQSVIDAHPALRTAFLWDGLARPMQVVRHRAELEFETLDWRDRPADEVEPQFSELLAEDEGRGIQPNRAPLMRVTCVRTHEDQARLIWTSHHLVVDRWCLQTILGDLLAAYESHLGGGGARKRGPRGSFRDYIAWIGRQSDDHGARHWREALHGLKAPTRLTIDEGPGHAVRGSDADEVRTLALTAAETTALVVHARALGVTTGVLVQGAWALAINRLLHDQDVVFGATVTGRTPEVPNVESTVGSFINNVPVRVRLPATRSIGDWLRGVQREQGDRAPFEHVALDTIHTGSGLAEHEPLFDHLLVWLETAEVPGGASIQFAPRRGVLRTAYPLALAIGLADGCLEVTATRRSGAVLVRPLSELLSAFAHALDGIAKAAPEQFLSTLDGFATDGSFQDDDPSLRAVEVPAELRTPRAERAAPPDGTPGPASATPNAAGRERLDPRLLAELISREWQGVLGRRAEDPRESFFTIGGNSLAAARLHTRLKKATRLDVPLLALFREPTIEGMTRVLDENEWPVTPDYVIPIRTRGEHAPLFCIASPEVNTVGYAILASYIGEDRPVYVVQAPPRDDRPRRLDPNDLLELAPRYCDAVQSIRSEGPFQLLSMCSGAHVAHAMARELGARGAHVGFVGVVNTWAFFSRSRLYHIERRWNRVRYYARRALSLARQAPGSQVASIREILARRRARGAAERSVSGGSGSKPTGDPWVDEFGWESAATRIERYEGSITVFRIRKQQSGRIRDRGLGWSKHASEVRVEELPGEDHLAILREPHVQEFARRIEKHLEGETSSRAAS